MASEAGLAEQAAAVAVRDLRQISILDVQLDRRRAGSFGGFLGSRLHGGTQYATGLF